MKISLGWVVAAVAVVAAIYFAFSANTARRVDYPPIRQEGDRIVADIIIPSERSTQQPIAQPSPSNRSTTAEPRLTPGVPSLRIDGGNPPSAQASARAISDAAWFERRWQQSYQRLTAAGVFQSLDDHLPTMRERIRVLDDERARLEADTRARGFYGPAYTQRRDVLDEQSRDMRAFVALNERKISICHEMNAVLARERRVLGYNTATVTEANRRDCAAVGVPIR